MNNETLLKELGVHPDCIDKEKLTDEISKHMQMGLSGTEGTMMMIPTYLKAEGHIEKGVPVAVIDAGGTNLRTASVLFDENGSRISGLSRTGMPGTKGQITADEMFDVFAEKVMPVMPDSGRLALCFSYAFESLPDGEGRIITMGKEVDVRDAEGTLIADGMQRAMRRAGYEGELHISVLNDTAAVLYSALATGEGDAASLILGTGLNTAYFERSNRIGKLPGLPQGRMAINMEAAYFSAVPAGAVDDDIDSASRNPGKARLEKMVSGAYLGAIAKECIERFAGRSMISRSAAGSIDSVLRIQDMSEFLECGTGRLAEIFDGESDARAVKDIISAVERRAGRITACLVASVMRRMRENGSDGVLPLAVNGSTLLLNSVIRSEFTDTLDSIPGVGRYRLIASDDDTILGTAAASFLG